MATQDRAVAEAVSSYELERAHLKLVDDRSRNLHHVSIDVDEINILVTEASQMAANDDINRIAVSNTRPKLQEAQDRGEAVTNLTDVTKYRKVRLGFLIEAAQQGDRFALEQLCLNAVSVVISSAKLELRNIQKDPLIGEFILDEDELIQSGLLQVPGIVAKYDPKFGIAYTALMKQKAGLAMKDSVRSQASTYGLSRSRWERLQKALSHSDYTVRVNQLVKDGFYEAWHYVIDGQIDASNISFDELYEIDSDEIETAIRAEDKEGIDRTLPESEMVEVNDMESFDAAIEKLEAEERYILCSFFGLFGYEIKSLAELGEEYGVTPSRISQIKAKAQRRFQSFYWGTEEAEVKHVRVRAGLDKLPVDTSQNKAIVLLQNRLNRLSSSVLKPEEITAALNVCSEWLPYHTYDKRDQITTLVRKLPDGLTSETAKLLNDVALKHGWKVTVIDGSVHLHMRNLTGSDLLASLKLERQWQKIKPPAFTETNIENLTPLGAQVLSMLHLPNSRIAYDLNIEESTARTHIYNLTKTLEASDAYELAAKAITAGYIDMDEVEVACTLEDLTPRQRDILAVAHKGTYQEIARIIDIQPATVRSHLHSVFTKTGMNSKRQLVVVAIKFGLIDPAKEW